MSPTAFRAGCTPSQVRAHEILDRIKAGDTSLSAVTVMRALTTLGDC